MRQDFRTFQYLSRAKILIHHGAPTDRKGRIGRKQAYSTVPSVYYTAKKRRKFYVFTLVHYNLNLNLNIYVAGPFSVDATGESWDDS